MSVVLAFQKLQIQSHNQGFNSINDVKKQVAYLLNTVPRYRKDLCQQFFSATKLYQQLPLGGASSLLISSEQAAALKAHKAISTFHCMYNLFSNFVLGPIYLISISQQFHLC